MNRAAYHQSVPRIRRDPTISSRPREDNYDNPDYDPIASGRQDYSRYRQMSQDRISNSLMRHEKEYEEKYRRHRRSSGNLRTELPPLKMQDYYKISNMLSDFERAPRLYPHDPMADSRDNFYDRKADDQLPPIQDPNNLNQSVALPLSMLLNDKNQEDGEEEEDDDNDEEDAKNFDLKVSLERQNMMLEKLAEKIRKSEKQRAKVKLNPRTQESYPNDPIPIPYPVYPSNKNDQISESDFNKRIFELEKNMEMKALIAQQREKIEKLEMMNLMQKKNAPETKEDEGTKLLRTLKDHMGNQQGNMMQMMLLADSLRNRNQNQIVPWPTQWGPPQMFGRPNSNPMGGYPTGGYPMPMGPISYGGGSYPGPVGGTNSNQNQPNNRP